MVTTNTRLEDYMILEQGQYIKQDWDYLWDCPFFYLFDAPPLFQAVETERPFFRWKYFDGIVFEDVDTNLDSEWYFQRGFNSLCDWYEYDFFEQPPITRVIMPNFRKTLRGDGGWAVIEAVQQKFRESLTM